MKRYNSVSAAKKEVLPPAIENKSSDFGDVVAGYKDDFLPTRSGNSPGVGHSFAEDDEVIEQKPGSISSSNEKHSIAGEKDLRATNPGHSPGVGHAFCIVGRILAKETGAILDPKINGVNINKAAVTNMQSPPSPRAVVVVATQAPPPKNADDFRPTAPGHSPGVGHSLQN
ncbi:hypothetical protein DITRI_Ditri18aG0093400 [Diplodiscus trichospermus]